MKNFIAALMFFFLIIQNNVVAQWQRVQDIPGDINRLVVSYEDQVCVSSYNGVYLSQDEGLHWVHHPIEKGMLMTTASAYANDGESLFVGSMRGIYKTNDNGKTWNQLGLDRTILSLYAIDSVLLAGQHGGGLWRSTDNGENWVPIIGDTFYHFISHGEKLFAASYSGVNVSEDLGRTWYNGNFSKLTISMTSNDSHFYANTFNALYLSDDNSNTWNPYPKDLPVKGVSLHSVFAYDNILLMSLSKNRVLISYNNGMDWQNFSDGIPYTESYTSYSNFTRCGNKIFISIYKQGVWFREINPLSERTE